MKEKTFTNILPSEVNKRFITKVIEMVNDITHNINIVHFYIIVICLYY